MPNVSEGSTRHGCLRAGGAYNCTMATIITSKGTPNLMLKMLKEPVWAAPRTPPWDFAAFTSGYACRTEIRCRSCCCEGMPLQVRCWHPQNRSVAKPHMAAACITLRIGPNTWPISNGGDIMRGTDANSQAQVAGSRCPAWLRATLSQICRQQRAPKLDAQANHTPTQTAGPAHTRCRRHQTAGDTERDSVVRKETDRPDG